MLNYVDRCKSKCVVTVAVISYNSSATIIETLNSIVTQSYGSENIELIISDDGSADNTIGVVKSWLNKCKNYFCRVELIEHSNNGGISKNCNSAWRAATSEWVKTIAGDDLLTIDCIEKNINYVNAHSYIDIVFSKMKHFINDDTSNIIKITPSNDSLPFFSLSAEKQFQYLLKNSFNIAPTSFIRRYILSDVGFCNETYRYIEDLPLWLKITKKGYRFMFMDEVTVLYRITNSLSNSTTRLINFDFIRQVYALHENEIWPNLRWWSYWRVLDKKIEHLSWIIPYYLFGNKRNFASMFLHYFISLLRPLAVKNTALRLIRLNK